MTKKILVGIGCSYTDKNFKSSDKTLHEDKKGGWPMWPELMANELNLDCINLGLCATGTDSMFNDFVSAISEFGDKIDTIAILLSGSDRCIHYQALDLLPIINFAGIPTSDDLYGEVQNSIDFFNKCTYVKSSYKRMIQNHFIKILAMIELCRYHKIKFIMKQGVTLFPHWPFDNLKKSHNAYIDKNQIGKFVVECKSFQVIDRSDSIHNIIGWPLYAPLGGNSYDDAILNNEKLKKMHCISDNDGHPNASGQILIAKDFIERHKELYP